jgi:lipoprotein-anchoring transpeptidase ErfK/SrfK
MLRTVALTLLAAVVALAPQAPVDFEAKFAAAAQDTAQVVPLIIDVSAALATVDGETGLKLADRLEPFCKRVFFSPERVPGMERVGVLLHTVAKDELPGSIARRYRIGAGMLAYLNAGYDERRIGAGKQLKVVDLSNQALQIMVDKSRFRLAAWQQIPTGVWVLALYAPVGLGTVETPTPSGTSRIIDRVRNPDWTDPVSHKVVRDGDPANVLGGYWIKLDCTELARGGIGLHGYTGSPSPNWLQQGASNGCVRMLQADIDRVFEFALEGTKVVLAP